MIDVVIGKQTACLYTSGSLCVRVLLHVLSSYIAVCVTITTVISNCMQDT